MNRYLERYNGKIILKSPMYIGSGKTLTKKEYIYQPECKKVLVLNFGKLLNDLKGKKKLQLQEYLMRNSKISLGDWLSQNSLPIEQDWIEYEFNLDDSVSVFEDEKFKGIALFQKDSFGCPYIPGSSLKGAIRTSLLKYWTSENQKDCTSEINRVEKESPKKKLAAVTKDLEKKSLSVKTSKKDKKGNFVEYDIMKGFQVSDSKPLSLSVLTLCQKIDVKPDGKENKLPILRECLKPGTEVEFTLTIDKTCFKKSISDIEKAIVYSSNAVQEWLNENFPSEYCEQYVENNLIYLGGGAGYLSKTFTYDLLDSDKAVKLARKVLPPVEGRREDSVVPRTMKKTYYDGKLYEMGLCQIEFERIN